MAYRCQCLLRVGKGKFILLKARIQYAVLLLLVSIKDLPIPLVANLIPEDDLTVISPGKNVKYMSPRGRSRYFGHTPIPPISFSHIKKIDPFFNKLRLNQRALFPSPLPGIFGFESTSRKHIPLETYIFMDIPVGPKLFLEIRI